MLTDAELTAIQVANAQTTPGPWSFAKVGDTFFVAAADGRIIARVESGDTSDAAWIGQSRRYIPALLAEVERLRAENATLANASARDMTVMVRASADLKAMHEIVQVVAQLPDPEYLDGMTCAFGCGADDDEPHTVDCPVTKARALLVSQDPQP